MNRHRGMVYWNKPSKGKIVWYVVISIVLKKNCITELNMNQRLIAYSSIAVWVFAVGNGISASNLTGIDVTAGGKDCKMEKMCKHIEEQNLNHQI